MSTFCRHFYCESKSSKGDLLLSFSAGVLDASEGRTVCRSGAELWIYLLSSSSRRYCAHGIGASVKAINEHLLVFRCTFGDVKCGWRKFQACRDKCGSACGKGIERTNMSSAPRSPLWNFSSLSGGRGVKVGESLWSGSFVGARIRRATGSNFNNQWKSWEVSKKSKRRTDTLLSVFCNHHMIFKRNRSSRVGA